jgi:hypothetical protein
MTDNVTQELIEDGMAHAETVACSPGDTRCYLGGTVLVSGSRCRS